eukprot:5726282-Amphidinium_carterae.1
MSKRDDLFAAMTSSNTARIIDCVAVVKRQHTFTADATKAYLQVPEPEEIYAVSYTHLRAHETEADL